MSQDRFLFQLGRIPELSFRELQVLLGEDKVSYFTPELVVASFADEEDAQVILDQVGGSLKLMKLEGEFTDLTEETLLEYVTAYFAQFERPTFAIAEFGRDTLPRVEDSKIKKMLREREVSSRFVEGPRGGLSASVLLHQGVTELNIIKVESKTYFARTIGIQNIDDWTVRDRRKPYADRKKGMLPPKLARIMVNLGLGQQDSSSLTIYDPFCGSGTVLLEGLMRGCTVIGSDLDQKAVMGSQNNLNWFHKEYGKPVGKRERVFVADATAVTLDHIGGSPVDLIVTEPFLGKQTPQLAQLPNVFRGLEKLYIGTFKQWTKILKNEGTVVVVMPIFEQGKIRFSLESIIDKLAAFGYTSEFDPIVYSRPEAIIQRQIWVFRYRK